MTKNKLLGYAVGPIGSALLGFITLPIVTQFYSVEDVGRISLLHVVASLLVLLFCLGLDQAYVREYHETDERPRLFKTVVAPGLTLLSLSLLVVLLFDTNLISSLMFSLEDLSLSFLTALCFLAVFISRFLSLILRMQERSFAYSMSQVLPKILFLIFIFTTYLFLAELDFTVLLAAHTLSIVTVLAVYAWNTRQELTDALKSKVNKTELSQLTAFGFPLVFAGLAFWGLKVTDVFFLRWLTGFKELGVYSVSLSIAGGAAVVASVFNIIWAPLVYKWQSEGEVDFNKIDNILEHLLAAVFFIVVLSGCFSWILMFLLDADNYWMVQYLVSACILAPLLYTLSEVTGIGVLIVKKTKLSMYASIIALMVNAIGNYFLVPIFGAAGAAVSTAISFFLFFVLRTEFSNQVWRKRRYYRVYVILLLLLLMTALNALYVKNFPVYVWWGCLFFGLVFFKASILEVPKLVSKREK